MFWRVRSFWVAAGAVAYVAFAALEAWHDPARAGGEPPARALAWLVLLGVPAALAASFALLAPPTRGEDRIDPSARGAARACAAGVAIFVAARSGPPGDAFTALANLGAGIASVASLVALARIASLGGLAVAPPSTRRLDAVAFAALPWTIAVALPAARALSPARAATLDTVAVDYATVAASLGSLGLAIAAAARARVQRAVELGAVDRAATALAVASLALLVGLAASAVGVLPPERLAPVAASIAAAGVAWSVAAPEPARVSDTLRVGLALAAPTLPLAIGAVVVARRASPWSSTGVFLACAASAVAGLAAPRLARRLAPEGTRWLDALGDATKAAMNPDPDVAVEAALVALRDAAGRVTGRPPALHRITPAEVVTVDRAGYAHVERAPLPEGLLALADAEPERVLRVEALRAVEVRRPEVRPILAWLDEHAIAVAAVVRDELEPIGVLTLPRGANARAMRLHEVRALRALADRVGAVVAASAMLARSRGRELEARGEAEKQLSEVTWLTAAIEREAGRAERLAEALARPVRVALYSPAARAAVEQIERVAQSGAPVALLVPPGVDAVAWASVAHLASPRRRDVLALVEATSPADQSPERWRDPRSSPLRAAASGTVVILDADALPLETQAAIAGGLHEGVGVVVTVPATIDVLVASGRLDERLADRLGDRTIAVPSLAARAEDLRGLVLDRLARFGARTRGRALGVEPAALLELTEHTWPGNDVELSDVLLRAALVARGDVVRAADLAAIGFRADTHAAAPPKVVAGGIPAPRRRRRPSGGRGA
jgi:hypothetical protein